MKHIIYVPVLLLLTNLYFTESKAQRTCTAMDILEYQEMTDPKMKRNRQKIEEHTRMAAMQSSARVEGIITIPVVVHVVYRTAAENISDAQVQSQITVLNDDFRRLNSDANSTWPQAADSEIEFCLASVDPNGNSTNGITRTQTTVTAFGTSDNVKSSASGGIDAWPAGDYLNIWVCNIGGGILGYAQFPGGNPATDGVVNDYRYFGTNGTATAPFDLGRTCTHEVGHWLNLYHIWGDGGCGVDDLVGDTPASDAANYGCATGHVSCSTTDMVENYMDYSDDACMNLYTSGQKTRMRALLNPGGARVSLLSSNGCGAGTTATCSDGVQNQGETGVDCGGPCPACTCSGTNVTVSITLDNYPEETTWEIMVAGGSVVASGGPYGSQPDGSTVSASVCLSDGCYDFTIYDSYGDGICCVYGNGSFNVTDENGNIFASGGGFGGSETTNFCLGGSTGPSCSDGVQNQGETGVDCGGPCPACGCTDIMVNLTFDDYPGETSWEILDVDDNVVVFGDGYGNQSPGTTVSETACLLAGCYDFVIYDSYGDGMCCAYGSGSYNVTSASGTVLASGGSFGISELTNICTSGGTGPGCSYTDLNISDFEQGWGIWNDGGSDARRSINDAQWAYSGSYCIRLRDDTNSSVMTTDNINLSAYDEINVDFTYITRSMDNASEDFWLQVSTDGGASFTTVEEWNQGDEFLNNQRKFDTVIIPGPFSANTKLRFRCDASGNGDYVYIDLVEIRGCQNANRLEESSSPDDIELEQESPVLSGVTLRPNPVRDVMQTVFKLNMEAEVQMAIYNVAGVRLYTRQLTGTRGTQYLQIDVRDFEVGMYLLQIKTPHSTIVRKFLVTK